jgi:hypothetical protein
MAELLRRKHGDGRSDDQASADDAGENRVLGALDVISSVSHGLIV